MQPASETPSRLSVKPETPETADESVRVILERIERRLANFEAVLDVLRPLIGKYAETGGGSVGLLAARRAMKGNGRG